MAGFTQAQKDAYARGEIDRFGKPINGGSQATIDPYSIITAQNQQTNAQNAARQAQIDAQVGRVQGANEYADAYDRYGLSTLQQGASAYQGYLPQNTAQAYGNAAGANANGQQLVNNLGNYYGGIAGGELGALGNYNSTMSGLQPVQWTNYQSNPNDVAAQRNAASALQGIANGSGDITAAQLNQVAMARASTYQAAQYQSSQADIDRQTQAYWNLEDIANGSLDWHSQAAEAYADPYTEQQQRKVYAQLQNFADGWGDVKSKAEDVHVSDETLQQQKQGIDKLWALTDPSITANERFMMEQARREQESSERASRGAVMSDLKARGMGGSGLEMSNMLGQQEQFGQERTLADLGAQATAVQRATNALGMYVDATGNLRSQEFDEAFSRAAAGDAMAVANANRRLQATGMAADQINNMRQQSFDEAYKRGLAADNASAANQATRLQGSGMAASQANAIRQANDNVGMFNTEQTNIARNNNANRETEVSIANAHETNAVGMFNVGEQNRIGIANQQNRTQGAIGYADQTNAIRSANDMVGTFNASQQGITDRFNRQQASTDAYNTMQVNRGVASDLAGLGQSYTNTALGENNAAWGRNQAAIDNEHSNKREDYNINANLAAAYSGYGTNQFNRNLAAAGVATGAAQSGIQNNLNANQLANQSTQFKIQNDAYDAALAELQKPQSGGLFGIVTNPLKAFGFGG